MPIRQIGYDGPSYRAQLLKKNVKRVYPVITIVLYFGMEHWSYSHHLKELVDIPKRYGPYISDYEMKNLFEVAFLEPEQVKWFKSDFRYVADYFVQMRLTNDYKPSPNTIEHVDAVLKLMSVLTGDQRFEEGIPAIQRKKGAISMESVLDRIEDKGRAQGRTEGITIGEKRGELKGKVSVYYIDMRLSPEQIAQKLNQPLDVILQIIQDLK